MGGGGDRISDDPLLFGNISSKTPPLLSICVSPLSPLSSFAQQSSSSELEGEHVPSFRAYLDLLRSYENPPERTLTLQQCKDAILSHKPGDWIGSTGGLTAEDYEVPEVTSLLLVGPRGSGKSALVNRIARVFEDDKFAPDLAQVYDNVSATSGSCFLQEYMIPRKSKSLCIYDSRSLSTSTSDNFSMLNSWMTQGVRHGQMVIRDSDDDSMKALIKSKECSGGVSPCQKRDVNFVIFVVDGISVLKSANGKNPEYTKMFVEAFNYAFLSFRDTKPAVVITHGDELSFPERARARIFLGEILGVPPKQTFDIPDASDYNTELVILDMLRYSIEHADRNLPFKKSISLLGRRIFPKEIKIRDDDLGMIVELLIVFLCFIFILLRLVSWVTNK